MSLYIMVLLLVAIFISWEAYGKEYIESYINTEYGHDIKQTYNNSELIKELLDNES